MKKISLVFLSLLTIFMISCEGPAGPPGPPGLDGFDGLDGLDGVNILGSVFEITDNFTPANNYSLLVEFPQSIEVFETDVVLVYILWEEVEDNSGAPVDVWRLMPQTRLLNEGILQYNFDHTFLDVSIFLESDFDLSLLPSGDTDNQTFRIAVLPADGINGANLDVSNLDAVMNYLKVDAEHIPSVEDLN